jgi:glycosyltransferase involved in cell wall biosynthesis
MNHPLRVGVLSTYAPRACGLATFAADLESALDASPAVRQVDILRMQNEYPPDQKLLEFATGATPVLIDVCENDIDSYREAADSANTNCDVVILQHEFGIFGGSDGRYALYFSERLRVPLIVTLHTVLPRFSSGQLAVLEAICAQAEFVTVFTNVAKELLLDQHIVAASKIRIVPHGAPDVLYGGDRDTARAEFELENRFVISSFGLVSPGKGLELAIEALPQVLPLVPNALLIIAGRTHPGAHRNEGEAYRGRLADRIGALGLEQNVRFIDEFLSAGAIGSLLAATDVFVTPYINLDQIVSGVLTFALAAGCPVVSTDFRYAREQLAGGAGVIVQTREPEEFADGVLKYALDPEAMEHARRASLEVGAAMHWSSIGADMVLLCQAAKRVDEVKGTAEVEEVEESFGSRVIALPTTPATKLGKDRAQSKERTLSNTLHSIAVAQRCVPHVAKSAIAKTIARGYLDAIDAPAHPSLPVFPTLHLRRLVDDTGIVQHATGAVPLLASGYCVDDVARLIPVAHRLSGVYPEWGIVTARSIAFLEHAASENLTLSGVAMSNFLSWDRRWVDPPHFGDHVGRAAWGLAAVADDIRYVDVVSPFLRRLFQEWPSNGPLHSLAYCLLAQASAPTLVSDRRRGQMLTELVDAHTKSATPTWDWFEPRLRYDYAVYPHALIAAGSVAEHDNGVELGLRTLRWLDRVCDAGQYFRFPGCRGLGPGESAADSGDEQPLEALALVQAHVCAFDVTGDPWHRRRAERAHEWFLGQNRPGLALVDKEGGCYDGLEQMSVNRNQGAESTLAYAASVQAVQLLQKVGAPELLVIV